MSDQKDFSVQLYEFAKAITQISFEGGDADGGQIQDLAEKLGLLREEPFDPDNEEHQNVCEAGEFETGMPVYFLKDLPAPKMLILGSAYTQSNKVFVETITGPMPVENFGELGGINTAVHIEFGRVLYITAKVERLKAKGE